MEDNQHIIEYLDYYVKINDPRFAVLLKGKWGCGKTFFIKELINKWNLQISDCKDKIILKPIYISLYGMSSVIMISDKLRSELNPLLYSKEVKFIKNLLVGTLRLTKKINLSDGGIQDDDDLFSYDINPINLLGISNKIIGGDKILIFDDLERCKIPLDELFGYINNFVEHHHCKVIFIADEDKINKENKYNKFCYNDFKEKLIGKTFEIVPDYHKAIDSLLHQSNNNSLKNNCNLVYDIFIASKTNNLRILRQSFIDFDRFETLIDEEIKEHQRYNGFIKELIFYFIVFYCEYKIINSDIISDLDSEDPNILKDNEYDKYDQKYRLVQIKFSIFSGFSVYLFGDINKFIKTGFINKSVLNIDLKTNKYFINLNPNNVKKLHHFEILSNSEFEFLYKTVKSDFDNLKINSIYELFILFETFLYLDDMKVIECNRENIVKKMKQNICKITQDYTLEKIEEEFDEILFIEIKSKEQKEAYHYYLSKVKEKTDELATSILKNCFENLNDSNIENMNICMFNNLEIYELPIFQTSIFKPIDIEILAEKVMQLSNENKWRFITFIRHRYRHYYCENDYFQGDNNKLVDLMAALNVEISKTNYVDKYVLNVIFKTIKKSIRTISLSESKEEISSYLKNTDLADVKPFEKYLANED